MNPLFPYQDSPRAFHALATCLLASSAVLIVGCASTVSTTPITQPGNTTVTVLATSTANDQLAHFDMDFNTITLTSQSGKTVTLLPALEHTEFIHLNAKSEPLFTVSLPQDTYTSAAATIGGENFSCFTGNPAASFSEASYSYGYTPDSQVTVNLPAPFTVSGNSMVLSLDLLVSQSASWAGSTCTNVPPGSAFLITPTFDLSPAPSSSLAMKGLNGLIASIDSVANTFTVTASDEPDPGIASTGASETWNAPTWQVSATAGTALQGVAGLSGLTVGMPVDMDASLQPDGSLVATRIAVYDTNTATLSTDSGQLLTVLSSGPDLLPATNDTSGSLFNAGTGIEAGGSTSVGYGSAVFQTSGELSNLQQLPFSASFTAANIVAGQNLLITSHALSMPPAPLYAPASTITLMPQTINGVVTAVSTAGGFDTYTVSLAPYDLFPQLAVQGIQTTVLSNPSTVVVYADSNVQQLNTQPIAVGSLLRFNGLVFNDSGTLRMDCARIMDGVTETAIAPQAKL
jgi:hypothetical protein